MAHMVRAGVLGALAGGALGLATGLLVAPEEGKKVRRRLLYQAENAALRTGLFLEELLRSDAESGEARRTGDALVKDAEARAKRIREDIDALLNELRQ